MTFEPTVSGLLMKSSVNSGPHSTITPPISWPRVNGQGSGFGQWPLRICRSVPHTPHAPILISAAFRGTSGHGTRCITGGAPGPAKVATRIVFMTEDGQQMAEDRCATSLVGPLSSVLSLLT